MAWEFVARNDANKLPEDSQKVSPVEALAQAHFGAHQTPFHPVRLSCAPLVGNATEQLKLREALTAEVVPTWSTKSTTC
jgi:hypothetical protein